MLDFFRSWVMLISVQPVYHHLDIQLFFPPSPQIVVVFSGGENQKYKFLTIVKKRIRKP